MNYSKKNNIMEKLTKEENKPDFQQLLETLKKETSTANQLALEIKYMSENLKPILDNRDECETVSVEPTTVISHFWEQIGFLQKTNQELLLVKNHLQQVIGG